MVLYGYQCNPSIWLGVYVADPLDCLPHILSNPSCTGSFFNHAAQNDNNCNCLTADVDCSDAANQEAKSAVNVHFLGTASPPPPSPPPAPPPLVCDNTCPFASDGDCDDGGPGAEYLTVLGIHVSCGYGTDCGDCGARSALPTSLRAEAHAEKFTAGDAVAAYQEVRRQPLAPMLARSHAILICSTA